MRPLKENIKYTYIKTRKNWTGFKPETSGALKFWDFFKFNYSVSRDFRVKVKEKLNMIISLRKCYDKNDSASPPWDVPFYQCFKAMINVNF